MDKYVIKEKVMEIVNKISSHKINNIDLDSDLKNELTLDSIQLVELFAMLEHEFSIELPLKMMTVKTSREFLQILDEQLKGKLQHSA